VAKVIVGMTISLDGFVAGQNGHVIQSANGKPNQLQR
jgi:hypothetical protein